MMLIVVNAAAAAAGELMSGNLWFVTVMKLRCQRQPDDEVLRVNGYGTRLVSVTWRRFDAVVCRQFISHSETDELSTYSDAVW